MSAATRPPEAPAATEVERHRMPLIEHLRELRSRLLKSLIALGIGMTAGFSVATDLWNLLCAPMRVTMGKVDNGWDRWYASFATPLMETFGIEPVDGTLAITNSPAEGFYAWFYVAFIGGAVLASPVIAYQIWAFVAPGLYSTEKRTVIPLAASSAVLFSLGAAFCYVVIFPLTFPFFLGAVDAEPVISVTGYLQSAVWMMVSFGLSFELPIAVWFLARLGLVDHRDLIRVFRYALVVIVAAAAIITPPDVISQVLLSIPLIGLYVLSIGVAWAATTKKREAGAGG